MEGSNASLGCSARIKPLVAIAFRCPWELKHLMREKEGCRPRPCPTTRPAQTNGGLNCIFPSFFVHHRPGNPDGPRPPSDRWITQKPGLPSLLGLNRAFTFLTPAFVAFSVRRLILPGFCWRIRANPPTAVLRTRVACQKRRDTTLRFTTTLHFYTLHFLIFKCRFLSLFLFITFPSFIPRGS
ncbi:hypothetical protein VTI74DRAFT_6884 [Chaetomium olivicolor]